jgi:chromate transport protein ChrA
MGAMDAPADESPDTLSKTPGLVSPWRLFRLWVGIGAQSFGGGMATSALIRQTFVERLQWITDEEYALAQPLVQPVPGMNLLALTILLGQRFGGTPGIFASLLGLLLPSVTMALLITAFFSRVRDNPAVQAALRNGIVPATVGIGLYSNYHSGGGLLRASGKDGRAAFVAYLLLMIVSGVLAATTSLPVFLLLGGAGAAGIGINLWQSRHSRKEAMEP